MGLLQHPASKCSGPIEQLPGPAQSNSRLNLKTHHTVASLKLRISYYQQIHHKYILFQLW